MLWATPRSRSTAFFRMMAERGDFTVVHEPFSYLAEFGYADVTHACYLGPITGGGTACPSPDSFLFWDGEHPTEAGHQLVAAAALNAIPEPGMLAGFLAAGLLLIRRRERKRAGR